MRSAGELGDFGCKEGIMEPKNGKVGGLEEAVGTERQVLCFFLWFSLKLCKVSGLLSAQESIPLVPSPFSTFQTQNQT